jgi:hypothetical protein
MGAWPEPLGGNASQSVTFGPLINGIETELLTIVGGGWTATSFLGATTAYFYPFIMQHYFAPLNITLHCGGSDGDTWKFAIVDEAGNQMCVTAGHVTTSQANTPQTESFLTSPILPPGNYYLGWSNNGATSSYYTSPAVTISKMRAMGCRGSASALGTTNTLIAYPDLTPVPNVSLLGMVNV